MSSATENQAKKRAYDKESGDEIVDAKSGKVENGKGKYESAFNMITTSEIICDVFSFLDKDQIERVQLVNQFWNNVIIRHKNLLPLRQFAYLFANYYDQKYLFDIYATEEDWSEISSYSIKFDGTNLSKNEEVSSKYSQLTVNEVLTNLNNVVYENIRICDCNSEDRLVYFLNLMKLVTAKTGGKFRGRFGDFYEGRFGSKLDEIFDNYIIVDELSLIDEDDSYIREVCANPEIVQLPSTPKEIRLVQLKFKENEEVLNFNCNGKLNGANRLTIQFVTSTTNYGNFIRQWFELYRTHKNPISLVGKFKFGTFLSNAFDAVETFLNNTQLRVKYSLETKEFLDDYGHSSTCQYFIRRCVLHETDSYALVIEMAYVHRYQETDMSRINASDLDQPPCDEIETISLCVKSL